jgi:hypothetical protein
LSRDGSSGIGLKLIVGLWRGTKTGEKAAAKERQRSGKGAHGPQPGVIF